MLHLHHANRYETLLALLLAQLDRARVQDRARGQSAASTSFAGAGPFQRDAVVVPSTAVRRSITLALADQRGIAAGIDYAYLAPWLWQQVACVLPHLATPSPLESSTLAWRVLRVFGDAAWVAPWPRLARYLADADAVMRWDLASRVAGVFDQMATYRPDWLDTWAAGQRLPAATWQVPGTSASEQALARDDEAWQAALWLSLQQQDAALASAGTHAELMRALAAVTAQQAQARGLPSAESSNAAHVFALPTMPPVHRDWLRLLAQRMELHVYVLNPCEAYWYEVVDRRRLSWLQRQGRDEAHEVGNRLLAAWGRQTQTAIDGLMQLTSEEAPDTTCFTPHEGGHLLAELHNAVLELRELAPGSVTLAATDRSIEVHVCHTLTRELEVLHDRLLGLLAEGAIQHASEVLVAVPELESAAPLIDAVFGTAPPSRALPYRITGRARSVANPLARVFLQAWQLAMSRWRVNEVLALIKEPAVARRLAWSEDDLQTVSRWLREADIHWAADAAHREAVGLPATPAGTWAQGLERLFLGHALPDSPDSPDLAEPRAFGGVWPVGGAEGSRAEALGGLWRLVQVLQRWRHFSAQTPQAERWATQLQDSVLEMLAPAREDAADAEELRAAIAQLADQWQRAAVGAEPLSAPVVLAALQALLDDPARGGVPSGGITFTSMSSLRGLPFKVVAVIGLDDGRYPGRDQPPDFDLMARAPKRGDRQRRQDDRNVMLDLLLAARSHLHLSYCGRDVRKNTPLPPSVLVSELLDVLVPAIAPADAGAQDLQAARERLVVQHPMQPWSWEAFAAQGDARLRSRQADWYEVLGQSVAQDAQPRVSEPAAESGVVLGLGEGEDGEAEGDPDGDDPADTSQVAFVTGSMPLPPPDAWPRQVTLDELIRFLENPSRTLLRQRLAISLQREEAPLDDDEALSLDHRQQRDLVTPWVKRLLAAGAVSEQAAIDEEIHAQLTPGALGHGLPLGVSWPVGALGAAALADVGTRARRLHEAVRREWGRPEGPLPAPLPPVALDFKMAVTAPEATESWRLTGQLQGLRHMGVGATADSAGASSLRLVHWSAGPLWPSRLLRAWVWHLAWHAAAAEGGLDEAVRAAMPAGLTSCIGEDDTVRFAPVTDARERLADLVALYRQGLCEPVHFFARSAWAWITHERSMPKAQAAWLSPRADGNERGESLDAAHALVLRGIQASPLDEAFVQSAERVCLPMLQALCDASGAPLRPEP